MKILNAFWIGGMLVSILEEQWNVFAVMFVIWILIVIWNRGGLDG